MRSVRGWQAFPRGGEPPLRGPKGRARIRWSAAWAEARRLLWQHRRSLGLGFLVLLINRAAAFVPPASTKVLIDDVLGRGHAQLLLPLAAAVGLATLVQAATSFALSQIVSIAAQKAIADTRRRLAEHVLRLPVAFFDGTQSGALVARILNDPEGIRNLVGTGLVQLLGGVLTAALALGVLFALNWQLTVATLLLLGVFGAALAVAFRRLRPIFRQRNEVTARLTGRLAESLGGIRVIKAYGAERREDRAVARGIHDLFRLVARSITGVSAVSAVSTLIVGAIGVVLLLIGGRAVLGGTMTLGDLVMYVFFTGLMAAPVVQIAQVGTQITEAFAGLDRVHELLQHPREDVVLGTGARRPPGRLRGEVVFENVSFAYVLGQPVLRNVSLAAEPGTTVALVGSSGAGKSTLVGLVLGFYRPQQGRVLVDGLDLAELDLRAYRAQVGVVLQDNFLFDGTIADNIRFARPNATRAEVEWAGRIAHCEEFVRRFPDGYDTVIGERGVKLSGGQRQRVAIARAILADPRILILDEATSHLDVESEALIQEALQRLRAGRTTFVIAHRLSTIRTADQILVLEDGEIVERGTHDELLRRGGRYRELVEQQYAVLWDRFLNPGEEPAEDDAAPDLPTPPRVSLWRPG